MKKRYDYRVMMEEEKFLPVIAIVDENTFSAMGIKYLLGAIGQSAQIEIYNSFDELSAKAQLKRIVHYFISAKVLFEHNSFFLPMARRTIIMACGEIPFISSEKYHVLNVSRPEKEIVKDILAIYRQGHSHPAQIQNVSSDNILSKREKEILRMVVMGFINKEIADKFSISLTTVITHRKNITRKLEIKSLSGLTIYAVTTGIVRLEEI